MDRGLFAWLVIWPNVPGVLDELVLLMLKLGLLGWK